MELQLWKAKETITIKGKPETIDFSARELLLSSIPEAVGRNSGYSIQDMRIRKEAIALLEKAEDEGSLKLNKDMAGFLVKRLSLIRLPFHLENVIKLSDDLNNLYGSLSTGNTESN